MGADQFAVAKDTADVQDLWAVEGIEFVVVVEWVYLELLVSGNGRL